MKEGLLDEKHYGYYTRGDSSEVTYNDDALSLPYFMCFRKTSFSMEILKKFDMECVIGQLSYKQRAEIYNGYHGYDGNSFELEQRYVSVCANLCVVAINGYLKINCYVNISYNV